MQVEHWPGQDGGHGAAPGAASGQMSPDVTRTPGRDLLNLVSRSRLWYYDVPSLALDIFLARKKIIVEYLHHYRGLKCQLVLEEPSDVPFCDEQPHRLKWKGRVLNFWTLIQMFSRWFLGFVRSEK